MKEDIKEGIKRFTLLGREGYIKLKCEKEKWELKEMWAGKQQS